ncbi:tyrosine-type recombinase/integrase [Amycolatopsis cihanbeyliensis]|uniref:Site-specific recombinase XerD n=1 Tax=Amycolatopsis cihanbeyliensis TaxID=1128664 RepID=A0A542DLG7_AMYCI|nr:tyrosine-type recombinase/integrase [Amycolatopsis cihanbeyliensis]TQJ01633.1 site-specific recombinase XerD [Amycolatopsis cihanbeyliensis]TQJ03940.1 site-specific recombinase XerD [Amycolatopsis cihanbeyliensis]
MVHVLHSEVVGPLEPYADGFARELVRRGYAVNAAAHQLGLVAHLSRWMMSQRLEAVDLTPEALGQYVEVRRRTGHRNLRTVKALTPLLEYLRGLGSVPVMESPTPQTAAARLLQQYRDYLIEDRDLRPKVVVGYVESVRPFIEAHVRAGAGELSVLRAADVTAFMVASSRWLAPKTVQRQASALRSLLRYWHVQGLLATSLVEAVPKIATGYPAVPRALPPAQVNELLASCDRDCVTGRRDFAMLILLSRLGLRSGEVAGLGLDDVDWQCGEITVTGKGPRSDRLPLPDDVGQALVDYLCHGRPAGALDRSVFIRIKAPHHGLTAGGVTQAVAAAAHRAGVGTVYAHRLRHSAATSMLAAGASLAEIGQVLRHRGSVTTAAYATVDVAALRTLARPWPTGGVS